MAVSRGEVGRAQRIREMSRKYVKVLAPIFTKYESFRLKVRNGNGKRTIHEVAYFFMYWWGIGRPLSAATCDSRQRSSFAQFDLE
jgi:hypothetical protein